MAVRSKLWYLQHFKLADALDDAQRRLLAETTRMEEVKRGRLIYQPGDPGEHVFLVKRGVIKVTSGIAPGGEVLLSFRHPGDVFGELALVDEAPRDHFARVHEDALICALAAQVLRRLAQESPEISRRFLGILGRRIRQFGGRIEQLSQKSAPARLVRALLDLSEEHGVRDGRGTVIAFRVSQSDLASFVALTRETVNIILRDLQRLGLLEADRRVIRLLDLERLRLTYLDR